MRGGGGRRERSDREKKIIDMFIYLDYYEAVAQAILSAKSEIYIEDWWLVSQILHILGVKWVYINISLSLSLCRVHN